MSKFFLYRNLRTKTWSKRSTKRIVVDHPKEICLLDVEFVVSQKIRERVMKNKRKEVHAGVRGLESNENILMQDISTLEEVTYNPYKYHTFVRVKDDSPVHHADFVFMDSNMKVWAINPR